MRTSLLLALLLFLALIGLNACEPVDDDPVETSASELLGTWVYLPSAPYDTLHQYLVLNDNGVFSRLNRQQYNLHTLLDGYYVISGDNLLLDYEIYRYQLNAQDANLWISSNPGDTLFYVRADEERDPGEWLIDLPIVDRTEINLKTISTAFLEFDGTAMWGYQDGDSGRGMVQFSMSGDSLAFHPREYYHPFTFGDGDLLIYFQSILYRIDPDTWEDLDSLLIDDPVYYTRSIWYDDGTLWIDGMGDMRHYNLATGTLIDSCTTSFSLDELTWVGGKPYGLINNSVVELDIESGNCVNTYDATSINNNYGMNSLATDGEYLYTLNYDIFEQKYELIKLAFPE